MDSLPGIGESHSNRVAAGVTDRIGDYLPQQHNTRQPLVDCTHIYIHIFFSHHGTYQIESIIQLVRWMMNADFFMLTYVFLKTYSYTHNIFDVDEIYENEGNNYVDVTSILIHSMLVVLY